MLPCVAVAFALAFAPAPLEKSSSPSGRLRQKEQRDGLKVPLLKRMDALHRGQATFGEVVEASKRLLFADVTLARGNPAGRLAAWMGHLRTVRYALRVMQDGYEAGRQTASDYYEAKAAVVAEEAGFLEAGGSGEELKEYRSDASWRLNRR
jgi:hypothetical protein